MAKKLILIDQSIAGIAGHHYEYAVHVLRAAERMGYEAVLVSNAAFAESPQQPPWKTHAIYRHGFWASEGAPKLNLVALVISVIAWLRFRLRLLKHFSLPGLLWMYRDNLTEFIGMQMLRRGNPVELAPLVALASLMKIARLLLILALLPAAAVAFVISLAAKLFRGGLAPAYLHQLTADIRDLGRFFEKTFSQRNIWLKKLQRRKHQSAFMRDTEAMLRATQPGADDIIFIPTISVIELAGLADLLSTNAEARRPTWHMLFRRNIFLGRECDYQHQNTAVAEMQQSFRSSAAKLKSARVRFYTDTEELTRQYNRLNVFPFETVPIPHTHTPVSTSSLNRPLKVLYIGDARAEKGYHHIPRIVEDLWERYVEPGKVTFHIQSNFNIPDGEPRAVVARGQLEHLARQLPGAITLITEPLTSEQYRDLLLSGDINLLCYDPNNYYARSSGILVESLSAGMPVIVPAGTWLSQQFRQEVARWHNSMVERMLVLKGRRMEELKWRLTSQDRGEPMQHGELLAAQKNPTYSWVRVPEAATHLLLRLRISESGAEAMVRIRQYDSSRNEVSSGAARLIERDHAGRGTKMLKLHSSAVRLRVELSSNRPGMTASVNEFELLFLSPREGFPAPPLSVIGTVYHEEAEIPERVRELIEHYGHYAESARAFAPHWTGYHNAEQLVSALAGQPRPAAAEAAV